MVVACKMVSVVRGPRHYFEIFWTVIVSLSIFMVDNLGATKFPPERFFHHHSMLPLISSLHPDIDIPVPYNALVMELKLPAIRSIAARDRAVTAIRFVGPAHEVATALLTDHPHHVDNDYIKLKREEN